MQYPWGRWLERGRTFYKLNVIIVTRGVFALHQSNEFPEVFMNHPASLFAWGQSGGGGGSMFYSSNMIRKFLNFDPLNNGLLSVCTTLGIQNKAKLLSSLYNTAFNLPISYWSTEIHDRLGTGNIAFKIVFSFLAILTNQNFFARVDNSLMTLIS